MKILNTIWKFPILDENSRYYMKIPNTTWKFPILYENSPYYVKFSIIPVLTKLKFSRSNTRLILRSPNNISYYPDHGCIRYYTQNINNLKQNVLCKNAQNLHSRIKAGWYTTFAQYNWAPKQVKKNLYIR